MLVSPLMVNHWLASHIDWMGLFCRVSPLIALGSDLRHCIRIMYRWHHAMESWLKNGSTWFIGGDMHRLLRWTRYDLVGNEMGCVHILSDGWNAFEVRTKRFHSTPKQFAVFANRGDIRRLWSGALVALPSGAGAALSVLGGNVGSLVRECNEANSFE